MYYRSHENKDQSVSYQFYYQGYDHVTRKTKLKQKTFRLKPEYVGKKKYTEKFIFNCEKTIQDEEEQISHGNFVKKEKNKFIDFATQVVENIIIEKPEAYYHYYWCKGNLKIIEDYLGNYYMHEINQFIIQDFCNNICRRTHKKITITVSNSLRPMIMERKITLIKIAKECGMADTTLHSALVVGNTVSHETATSICDFLGVSVGKYFNIQTQNIPYSLSANKGLKALLSKILDKAVKRGLIDRNYALKEFSDSVTGTEGEKEIYSQNEVHEFMCCIIKEKDLRKKTAFSIMLYLGLRIGEIAGLEWSDINFDKDEISIKRNSIYVSGFGTRTKAPKTKYSIATISVPKSLMDIFKEYNDWWVKQKALHGDLWQNTDRLFCQSNGNDMSGSTIRAWLVDFQQKNNLKHVTPHGLRHTNITLQIANGVDIKTVSTRARHSNIQTTLNIYAHPTTQADKNAASIIDKFLSNI